jgi:hypothetical protein
MVDARRVTAGDLVRVKSRQMPYRCALTVERATRLIEQRTIWSMTRADSIPRCGRTNRVRRHRGGFTATVEGVDTTVDNRPPY